MRKPLITVFIICLAAAAQAQTARIAHRSHSGANKVFNAKKGDHFGAIFEHPGVPRDMPKLKAPDTVKVIKVKPWRPVKDTMPPKVNPIYTRNKPAKNGQAGTAKSK